MSSIEEAISSVLAGLNPWWTDASARLERDRPIRRDLQREVLRSLERQGERRATVIVGPRQVGKSVLLRQTADDLLEGGIPPLNLVHFDFDDWRLPRVPAVTPEDVLALCPVPRDTAAPRILLLDEIQRFEDWDRWLKSAVDRGLGPIVATGSAAVHIRRGLRESGYGRWNEHRLETLSLSEFLRFHARGEEDLPDTLARFPNAFERYLALGGFPEHATATDYPEVRLLIGRHVIERAIYKDLEPLGVDAEAVATLFTYLVRESGSIFNASARGADMLKDSRSIKGWERILEDSHLVERLPRWTTKSGASLRAMPKVHACDHGLVVSMALGPRPNEDPVVRGRAMEAMAYRHLRSLTGHAADRIFYFRRRDGLEADFVVLLEEGTVVLEVTAARTPKGRKIDRLREVGRILGARDLVLLHGGLMQERDGSMQILSVERFLLEPEAVLKGGKR